MMLDLSPAEREQFLTNVVKIPIHSGLTKYWAEFYYSLILTQRPELVIETGVWAGYTTAWIALACKQVGAKFLSVDTFAPHPTKSENYTVLDVENYLRPCGVLDAVTLHEADALEFLECVDQTGLGLVILDDMHFYVDVIARIAAVWDSLKPRGLVLSHDSDLPEDSRDPNNWVGVRAAFTDWQAKTGCGFINLPGNHGVAILQKP
jgi:predicted O-methyltransferase YrrM